MKIPDLHSMLRMVRRLAPIVGLVYFGCGVFSWMTRILDTGPSAFELIAGLLAAAVLHSIWATSFVVSAIGLAEMANCSAAIWGRHALENSPYLGIVDRWLKWVGLAMIGLAAATGLFTLVGLLTNHMFGPIYIVSAGVRWGLTLIRSCVYALALFGFGEIIRILRNLAGSRNSQELRGAS